jgi:hypothetical protein
MICEYNKVCPFFNGIMRVSDIKIKIGKKKFCYKDKTKCARYIVAEKVGEKLVPSNLLPDMKEKAIKMVKMYKKV